jgi:hypothetical protein
MYMGGCGGMNRRSRSLCNLYGGAKSSHAQKWRSLSEETPNPEYPEGLAYKGEIDSPWHAQLV